MRTKHCRGCNTDVDVALFSIARQHRDGLHTYCRPCKTRLARRQRKLQTMGRSRFVPTGRARAHVQQLLDAGLTRHQIAEHAGVDRTVIRNLMVGQPHAGQGPGKRILRENEERLLAVVATACQPAPVAPGRSRRAGALVDPTGTIRRLRALMANGWPARELALRLDCHTPALQIKPHRRCTSSTAAAVAALYAELADVPGPSPRTASLYRHRGYLPPGWWDDDTIDDPTYRPQTDERAHWSDVDPIAVERACAGEHLDLTRAERIAAVLTLHERGVSTLGVARQLRMHPKQVSRDIAS